MQFKCTQTEHSLHDIHCTLSSFNVSSCWKHTAQISVSVQFNLSSHCIASVIVGLLIVLLESYLFFRVEKNFLCGILLELAAIFLIGMSTYDNAMDEILPNDSYINCSELVLSILPHKDSIWDKRHFIF